MGEQGGEVGQARCGVSDGHLGEIQVDDKEEREVQDLKVVHEVASARSQRRRHRAEEHLRVGHRDGLAGRVAGSRRRQETRDGSGRAEP